jgi:hypothetical protein
VHAVFVAFSFVAGEAKTETDLASLIQVAAGVLKRADNLLLFDTESYRVVGWKLQTRGQRKESDEGHE